MPRVQFPSSTPKCDASSVFASLTAPISVVETAPLGSSFFAVRSRSKVRWARRQYAFVAQLDRASDFESAGRRFDSCRARKEFFSKPSAPQRYEAQKPPGH